MHSEVATLLLEIEKALRALGLWESQPPSPQALASTQPFAVDTLAFHQWLQFIFLPRMSALVESGATLPSNCSIAPMAEEALKGTVTKKDANVAPLIAVLRQLDRLLTRPASH